MSVESLAFYSLAAVTVAGALGTVGFRNVLHSALALGLALLGVAGLFASLAADFLFAAQILVYVGGIAVLILFVVLLSGRASDLAARQVNSQWLAAALIAGVTFRGLWACIPSFEASVLSRARPSTHELGALLLGEYAVPFELVSLVLLAALAGAVVFSKSEEGNSAPPTENSPPRRGGEFPTPSPLGRASVPSEGDMSSREDDA